MIIILTLGVSSCKTTNHKLKPNHKLQFIKNVHSALEEKLPSIVVSKNKPKPQELKQVYPKLNSLMKLTGKQIHILLGTPKFKRSDSPAEMWQYNSKNCTLDLFLYENLATSIHSVAHYETRLQTGHDQTQKEFFFSIIKATTQIP
jgi:hypothetical protein